MKDAENVALEALYEQLSRPDADRWRPSLEIVHPREAFYRLKENPGAGKWEWFEWLGRWWMEVGEAQEVRE